jgi:hypothetical protein
METDNASPFIRGIQNRLDTIFGEDNKKSDHAEGAEPLEGDTKESDIPGVHPDDGGRDSKIEEVSQSKSMFVRGIENRLDAIFGEENKKSDHAGGADPLEADTQESDITGVHAANGIKDSKIEEAITSKSSFVRGIENRLDTIFGEDNKKSDDAEGVGSPKEITVDAEIPDLSKEDGKKDFYIDESVSVTAKETADHEKEHSIKTVGDKDMPEDTEKSDIHDLAAHKSLKESVLETKLSDEEDDKAKRFEQLFGALVTSTSIMYSPLKDLKSTVLSIEWEVTDQVMERFDKEVNKLSELFAEDKIILGFLKILHFLGRYIRVKGVEAHYISVKLLMAVYDNLEKVLLTKEMADAEKHEILCNDAKKYKEWVETVDLAVKREDARDRGEVPREDIKEAITKKDEGYMIAEPIILSKTQEESPGKETIHALKESAPTAGGTELTPHEAFAFAVEEIKKVISAEFSALRAELKLWRREK